MKVRIGVATGVGVADHPTQFLPLVDALDDLGYDSMWIPDVVTKSILDPVAALGVAAGRRKRLKLGTHLILPGRNPIFLAKQLATLDQLSDGRLLLLAVIGLREGMELAAQGVDASERTAMLEESLAIMRALWAGEAVAPGNVTLDVRPKQQPLEVWLGGQMPAALRRCGRIGEGWMPGLCTPEEAAAGRTVIEAEARSTGNHIDSEHFGVNISWVDGAISDAVRNGVTSRRPDLKPEDVIANGVGGLAERIESFLDVGFSKFVIRPASPPESWPRAVESVAGVLALQT